MSGPLHALRRPATPSTGQSQEALPLDPTESPPALLIGRKSPACVPSSSLPGRTVHLFIPRDGIRPVRSVGPVRWLDPLPRPVAPASRAQHFVRRHLILRAVLLSRRRRSPLRLLTPSIMPVQRLKGGPRAATLPPRAARLHLAQSDPALPVLLAASTGTRKMHTRRKVILCLSLQD